jgi:hypothetical protein
MSLRLPTSSGRYQAIRAPEGWSVVSYTVYPGWLETTLARYSSYSSGCSSAAPLATPIACLPATGAATMRDRLAPCQPHRPDGGPKMTGIRLCSSAISRYAFVVTMTKLRVTLPSGQRRRRAPRLLRAAPGHVLGLTHCVVDGGMAAVSRRGISPRAAH